MPRDDSPRRRLTTPKPDERSKEDTSRAARSHSQLEVREHRSRSPLRRNDREGRRSRERSRSRRSQSLLVHELELDRQRAILRALEEKVSRERSQLRRHDDARRPTSILDADVARKDDQPMRRASSRRGDGGRGDGERGDGGGSRNEAPARRTRSRSPSFSCKDVINIINSLKPQPVTNSALLSSNNVVNHKNILPDFDPSSKNQRTDIWLRKVNECATVYGWDERTTIHFAMQKLQGLAKLWYESQNTILFDWSEWQKKLLSAFPCEQNYGQSLEDMLRRKSRHNEPLDVYYYEKLSLLNQCDIVGKRAVDCLIHGLSDKTMRSSANAMRCTQPEQLLQFLMSNQDAPQTVDLSRTRYKAWPEQNNNYNLARRLPSRSQSSEVHCFNCKEKGHPYSKCPKPVLRCVKCNRIGHKAETCFFKNDVKSDDRNKAEVVSKTMRISTSDSNTKFIKDCKVNNAILKCFIDFGSEVNLITRTTAESLELCWDSATTALRGFGNDVVYSLGVLESDFSIDGVNARIVCHVVEDKLLDVPLLIGQSFTEQPHIVVFKNADELRFYNADLGLDQSENNQSNCSTIPVQIVADVHVVGPVMIKGHVDSITSGNILLDSKVIGQPNQQFVVNGGVYPVKAGYAYIYITPLSLGVSLNEGMVVARGKRVHVVNRILSPTSDTLASDLEDIDETKVRIGERISESHKQSLLELLQKYKHCFSSDLKSIGCTNVTEMEIELSSRKPVVYRPYRLSHKEREHVREMVGEMLEAGIVRESVSEFSSPIILVRKKDGGVRMCVDYRLLNSITVKERYPMPVIEDEIARLSGQAYFITLDLTSGYYQVPIADNSKPYTSFVTPDGQYEFNRMPFGLANAPAVFQRMINKVLGSSRFSEATAYIDDVLIYGKSVDECLERLERILKLIEQAHLTLNLSKCHFLLDKINYLGYEISVDGIRPGDKKIQSVLDFPRPSNPHSVRQFLGLVGYFRKFVRNFAALAHPLSKLLKKDAVWQWTDDQEEAFDALKKQLVDRPILAIYDQTAQTELHTDASKLGIGGILLQRSRDTDPFRPVAFYSRQTSPEEKNFHSFELETLAVVCSLQKFRVYLLGLDFKIVTDCSALRSTFSKRDLIPRIARWWLLLQEFQCTIEYRPGVKMSHVDALSRNPVVNIDSTPEPEQVSSIMTINSEDWLVTLQLGDSELRRTRDILNSDLDSDGLKYIKDNYLIKDNRLYRCVDGDKTKLRFVVPKGARWQVLRKNHDEIGHFGVQKTLERIKDSYWFPKMSRFVKKYVGACIECAYSKKVTNNDGQLHTITKVEVPFHTLHIDHLGPFVRSRRGNCHLLVVVDAFTKFVFAKPVRNTKSQTSIRVLEDIFSIFRNPDRIISDRGTSFTSHAFKRFCLNKGIRHVLNAVASPRSNGQVERYNRTILNSLTAQNLNDNEKDWDDKIGAIQWGMNNTCQKTTGKTPASVMFGYSMKSEIDPRLNEAVAETREDTDLVTIRESAKDNIDLEQNKQKERYDKNRRPARIYNEGDLVKITKTNFKNDGKSKKLLPCYIGPYRVVSVLGNDRYRVASIPGLTGSKNKRKTTVAADRMSPWVHVAALEIDNDEKDSDDNTLDSNSDCND